MDKRFNFQINSDKFRSWQEVPIITKKLPDRFKAVFIARQLAKLFDAEVRLTEGIDAFKTSGAYFSFQE